MVKKQDQPFGFEHGDPLIVCLNDLHRRIVQEAFKMRALYLDSWNRPLLGHRFGRIIVFRPPNLSGLEEERFTEWFGKYLPTKLVNPHGQIFLI